MSGTVIFIITLIVAVGLIVWFVFFSGRRGEEHRQKTTLKPSDSRRGGQAK